MKLEFVVLNIALFGLAQLLDLVAGSVGMKVGSPAIMMSSAFIKQYPLTLVLVAIRSVAITFSIATLFSLVEKKRLYKAFVVLVVAILFELYAIQQLATNSRLTTLEWTLALAYAPALMVVLSLVYLVGGVTQLIVGEQPKPEENEREIESPKEFKLS